MMRVQRRNRFCFRVFFGVRGFLGNLLRKAYILLYMCIKYWGLDVGGSLVFFVRLGILFIFFINRFWSFRWQFCMRWRSVLFIIQMRLSVFSKQFRQQDRRDFWLFTFQMFSLNLYREGVVGGLVWFFGCFFCFVSGGSFIGILFIFGVLGF